MVGGPAGGTTRGTMKINKKAGFPQGRAFTEEYNSLWHPKCGGDSESLNK
jgi:hypothetical protein